MIKVENLSHSYHKNLSLEGVDLHVKDKSFVGVVGPNGSGKSTLLKCIYRTLKPKNGQVFLQGKALDKMKLHDSAKVMSVVAQHTQLNFDFIVDDMVMMGRQPYKKSLDRNSMEDFDLVADALETVGMAGFSKRTFSSLSGGEQQRVILARALAQDPTCMILDEPTNHLDIKHQLQLLRIIKALNISVMAAVHDLNMAMTYCDYLYVMKAGQIVCHGRPKDIVTETLLEDVFEVKSKIYEQDGNKHIVFYDSI